MNKDLSRGNKYPFFPDYKHIITGVFEKGSPSMQVDIWIATTIRRQNRNGVWCFWDFSVNSRFYPESVEYITDKSNDLTKEFVAECYKVITIGFVDHRLVDDNGNPIFKRDPNQESETERLSRL